MSETVFETLRARMDEFITHVELRGTKPHAVLALLGAPTSSDLGVIFGDGLFRATLDEAFRDVARWWVEFGRLLGVEVDATSAQRLVYAYAQILWEEETRS